MSETGLLTFGCAVGFIAACGIVLLVREHLAEQRVREERAARIARRVGRKLREVA